MDKEYEYGWCPLCGGPESVCQGQCEEELLEELKENCGVDE